MSKQVHKPILPVVRLGDNFLWWNHIYTQGPNLDHTFLIPDFYLVHYPKQSLAIIADWDEDLVPEQYIIVLCQNHSKGKRNSLPLIYVSKVCYRRVCESTRPSVWYWRLAEGLGMRLVDLL